MNNLPIKKTIILFIGLSILISPSFVNTEVMYQLDTDYIQPRSPNPQPSAVERLVLHENNNQYLNSFEAVLADAPLKESEGAMLFRVFSKIMIAFEQLEYRDINAANKQLAKVSDDLKTIQISFNQHKDKFNNLNISISRIPKNKIDRIKQDLKFYGGEIPPNFSDLFSIVTSELTSFYSYIDNVKFGIDFNKNRTISREIIDKLYHYMSIGISVSEIIKNQNN